MIQLTAAGKRFGPKLLFEDLDWLITPKARLGLVGANGTGKSTLLKVLAGLEPLDDGSITYAKGISAGYLPQDGLSLSGRTVLAECLSVFEDLYDIERELETLTHRMAELEPDSSQYQQVSERYERLESHFRAGGGYTLEAQAGIVLSGLGFPQSDWERRTEEFSGGWQMRIALARLLLQQPNLLLLDEPTNHLDLEARNWLEGYLASYPHACVLISHDRYFLDVTVQEIAEIWNRRVHFYKGNYENYLAQKSERRAQIEAAYKNQQDKIHQLEVFINRFRYQATKAKQVQSRIKEIERMEKIELPREEKTIHFTFPQPRASGRIVAEFRSVAKNYGPKRVFNNVSFIIERAERIALLGVNGAGKSTLIRMLAGIEPLSAGEYRLGHNVQPDYFAQDQYKALDPEARLLDDLRAWCRGRKRSCAVCWAVSCFLTMMFSNASECSGASATVMRWHACCCVRQISCCSTNLRTTSTCAPKTCCSARSRTTAEPWCSSHMTATSSTSLQRACSRLAGVMCSFFPVITKITFGAKHTARTAQLS